MLVRDLKKFIEIVHGSALHLKYNASFLLIPTRTLEKGCKKVVIARFEIFVSSGNF